MLKLLIPSWVTDHLMSLQQCADIQHRINFFVFHTSSIMCMTFEVIMHIIIFSKADESTEIRKLPKILNDVKFVGNYSIIIEQFVIFINLFLLKFYQLLLINVSPFVLLVSNNSIYSKIWFLS